MKNALAAIGILMFVVACSKASQPAPASTASSGKTPAAAGPGQLAGTVAETFNSGGYTYMRLKTPTGEEWAAVPQTTIAQGDNVTLDVQMTMEKFESKTLNRTFDRIVFASLASGAPAASAAAAPPTGMTAMTHMQAPDAGDVAVEKAPGGKSVSEVFAEKGSLSGKEVIVRGKVVKYLAGIMGRNWMHLQDGTGSRENGDNDLTVTTDADASVGDVVTVRGVVAVDKDFGSGYRYTVIVEKATVGK